MTKCATILTLMAALLATGCVAKPAPELISLNSLIGNLENSLFESALSVQAPEEEHAINKRHDEEPKARALSPVTESSAGQVLSQTSKQVPASEDGGQPAHFVIDRVSVQPHNGGVPLVPTFQVHHTKVVSATIKEDGHSEGSSEGKQTKISITKTTITSNVESPEAQSSSNVSSTLETTESSSSAATTTTSTTTTTAQPIVKLKQAEEHLKEKVAEVEANPIILSSRV